MRVCRLLCTALLVGRSAFAFADADSDSKVTFQAGVEFMKSQQWEKACASFTASLATKASPATMLQLYECHKNLKHYATAKEYLDNAIAVVNNRLARTPDDPELLTEKKYADEESPIIAPLVPHLRFTTAERPAGLKVTKNGVDITSLIDQPVPADIGHFTIVASAAGYDSVTKEVDVTEPSEEVSVKIEALAKSKDEPSKDPGPAVEKSGGVEPELVDGPFLNSRRYAAIAIGAVGLVGIGIGSWAGLDAASQRDDARKRGCNDTLSMCTNDAAFSTAQDAYSRGNLATGMFIGGGVLIVAGAVLFAVSPSPKESASRTSWHLSPTVTPQQTGFALDVRF